PMKQLYGVWGSGPSDIWAVGDATMLRYDGSNWNPVTDFPPTGFHWAGVWGSSKSDVYVGSNIIAHFDGSAWSMDAIPTENVNGVWGLTATNIYAVGDKGTIWHRR